MRIKDFTCVVFDVEVLNNVFTCTLYNTETNMLTTYEVSERRNEMKQLINYFKDNSLIFVGYNNIHFDNVIINYCISYFDNDKYDAKKITNSIKNLSKIIINEDDFDRWKTWKYAKNFHTIDLLTMLYSQALRVSLKEMQVTMHYKNVQEFVVDWENDLPLGKVDELVNYNINDVMSTLELLNRCKNDLELRVSIEKEYGIDCLSKDGMKIGMEILKHKYLEYTGMRWENLKDLRSPMELIPLKDVILPFIKFNDAKLQALLENMKNITVSPERKGFEQSVLYSGTVYNIGVGGIHSKDEAGIITPTDDEFLIDCDVASLYPSLILEHKFVPRHLGDAFLSIYQAVKTERITAKRAGEKLKDLTLKLALNGVTGNYQNAHSWVYDPFAVMQIRVNGQLMLLMLAEMLTEAGCQVKSANTDGLTCIVPKANEQLYYDACKKWEDITSLVLEFQKYSKVVRLAVNDYIAVCADSGKIKQKGIFITDTILGKGLTPKIIPEALIEYFVKGTPIEKTILNCTDIRKFLKGEKTGKQWTVEYDDKIQQRTNRFYVSESGLYLWKWKLDKREPDINKGYFCGFTTGTYTDEEFAIRVAEYNKLGGVKQYQNMLVGYGVKLHNTFLSDDELQFLYSTGLTFNDIYGVNYSYYIKECQKIIEQIKPRQLSLWD